MGKRSAKNRHDHRGRPRKPGVPRTRSGRISEAKGVKEEIGKREKAESEQSAMGPALDARKRHHGAPEETIKDQRWSTAIGRLFLSTEISEEQYDASQTYLAVRMRYMRAIDTPGMPANVGEPMQPCAECGSEVLCDPCAAESKERKIHRYEAMMAVLDDLEKVIITSYPKLAIEMILIQDRDRPDLVTWLLIALSALAKHFAGKKAKASRGRFSHRRPASTATGQSDRHLRSFATFGEDAAAAPIPEEIDVGELEEAVTRLRAAGKKREQTRENKQ